MNRLENIRKRRLQIMTTTVKHFNETIAKTGVELKSVIKDRNKLHSARETRRPMHEKAILATERMIGPSDESREVPPNDNARKHGIPVARLCEEDAKKEPKGFGTGFLVAPNLLITNNHVFSNDGEAENCVANFLHDWNEATQKTDSGISFMLKPAIFFYTCEDLDFSLVYVENKDTGRESEICELGSLSLIETKGKIKFNSPVNIIQYPKGGVKKYTTEGNMVTNIDDKAGIIYYTTDTEPGSSGSPCFNEYWEVAALHYTAIPKTNPGGEWLTKNGQVWNKDMDEDEIDWIANAGKSISRIVSHLKHRKFPEEHQKYIDAILENTGDPLVVESAESLSQPALKTAESSGVNNIVMNFYGNTNIYFNSGFKINDKSGSGRQTITAGNELQEEKKERFDEDYSCRKGYNENFIPGFRVPVPEVARSRQKELYRNIDASIPFIVPYHHFSLVMNKARRMAMWTASNAHYDMRYRDERTRSEFGSGAWRLDPRIPARYQIQAEEFYDPATLVDKGHIVRRDDNCWAELKGNKPDSLGIEYANADTFHWTNCTPQHEAFNRDTAQYKGKGLWGVLENAIKEQLEPGENDEDKDYDRKACILAGPILKKDDPEYCDIQYPVKFWKVFAIKSKSEGRLVYGFILSQEETIKKKGLEKEGLPRFDRKVTALLASLKTIEEESGVVFDDLLHDADVMGENRKLKPLDKNLEIFMPGK
jgi:endonuclease G